ncbi:helix-turn-helix domain-containing protein [Bremerella alba]|uniref:Helix-turn-helix domain-containing protein n=1 Tax=Bremerella alba TaxID=980252 RepID=A0A7V8V8T4_9BACT|nr:helix-turn-helix domain-containing protein [Bremerella alba]MBA2117072.1 hypothetical protein [Bremerella alba]
MTSNQQGCGVISRQELYTTRQLKARLGISDASIREMKREGLPVIRLGKRAFISGNQIIEFLERRASNAQES